MYYEPSLHATDTHASKLSDILSCHSLHQHVYSPTHVHRHTLDLVITRDDQSVAVLPVDPPLLSDHAFVVADCSCPLPPSTTSTACRQVRNWRGLDAFDADLQQSNLFQAPPLDPETAFRCYDQTLHHILHQHAPLVTKRVSLRQSVAWYDSECHAMKRASISSAAIGLQSECLAHAVSYKGNCSKPNFYPTGCQLTTNVSVIHMHCGRPSTTCYNCHRSLPPTSSVLTTSPSSS